MRKYMQIYVCVCVCACVLLNRRGMTGKLKPRPGWVSAAGRMMPSSHRKIVSESCRPCRSV